MSKPRFTARPLVSMVPASWMIPASLSERYMLIARLWCFRCRIFGSWLLTRRSRRKRLPSPLRDKTARIIECVTWKEESRVSGTPVSIRRKLSSFHITKFLSGGCAFLTFLALPPLLAAAAAAFASALLFSTTCAGAWHHTNPLVSNPLRPARPAIC